MRHAASSGSGGVLPAGKWEEAGEAAEEPAAAPLAESEAFAADGDHVAVAEHAVKDGGGDDGVSEDAAPLGHGAVRGDQEAATLAAPAVGLGRARLWAWQTLNR